MTDEEVAMIYNDLLGGKINQICFSKGYRLFEEYYKACKKYNLGRKEIDYGSWIEVIVYVKQ